MNFNSELSIIIPCKNEANYIGTLLESIKKQTYKNLKETKIFIADAGSTDGTFEIIRKFENYLDINIIKGGSPVEGRNRGTKISQSKYILFIDTDIELKNPNTIEKALDYVKTKNLHLATIDILCKNPNILDRLFYGINNIIQHLSKYFKPYATGMFMLFDKNRFEEVGGFNEKIKYAEDYFLSRQIKRGCFGIIPGYIMATNRRFKRDGYFRIGKLFLKVALSKSDKMFYQDINYWD